jgi:hypothetical protein
MKEFCRFRPKIKRNPVGLQTGFIRYVLTPVRREDGCPYVLLTILKRTYASGVVVISARSKCRHELPNRGKTRLGDIYEASSGVSFPFHIYKLSVNSSMTFPSKGRKEKLAPSSFAPPHRFNHHHDWRRRLLVVYRWRQRGERNKWYEWL